MNTGTGKLYPILKPSQNIRWFAKVFTPASSNFLFCHNNHTCGRADIRDSWKCRRERLLIDGVTWSCSSMTWATSPAMESSFSWMGPTEEPFSSSRDVAPRWYRLGRSWNVNQHLYIVYTLDFSSDTVYERNNIATFTTSIT